MNILEAKRLLRKTGYILLSEKASDYENDIYTDEGEGGDPADTEEQDISDAYGTAMHIEEPELDDDYLEDDPRINADEIDYSEGVDEEEDVVEKYYDMDFSEIEKIIKNLKDKCTGYAERLARQICASFEYPSMAEHELRDEVLAFKDDPAFIDALAADINNQLSYGAVNITCGPGTTKSGRSTITINVPALYLYDDGSIMPNVFRLISAIRAYGEVQSGKPQAERTGYATVKVSDKARKLFNDSDFEGEGWWDDLFFRFVNSKDCKSSLQYALNGFRDDSVAGEGLDIDGADEEMTAGFTDDREDLYTDFDQHMQDDYGEEYVNIDED